MSSLNEQFREMVEYASMPEKELIRRIYFHDEKAIEEGLRRLAIATRNEKEEIREED